MCVNLEFREHYIVNGCIVWTTKEEVSRGELPKSSAWTCFFGDQESVDEYVAVTASQAKQKTEEPQVGMNLQ